MGIWQDDSDPADRRAMALHRLMQMCPAAFRVSMRPLVEVALSKASDAEIASLLIDVQSLPALAESGDSEGITRLAKKYGASDDAVATYLPLFQSMDVGKGA